MRSHLNGQLERVTAFDCNHRSAMGGWISVRVAPMFGDRSSSSSEWFKSNCINANSINPTAEDVTLMPSV